eukprot:g19423.t2
MEQLVALLGAAKRIRDAIRGVPAVETTLGERNDDYSSVIELLTEEAHTIPIKVIKHELDRLAKLVQRVVDLGSKHTAAAGDGVLKKIIKGVEVAANHVDINNELDEIDREVMRQLAIMNLKVALHRARDAIQGAPDLKANWSRRYGDYSSAIELIEKKADTINAYEIGREFERLTELLKRVEDLLGGVDDQMTMRDRKKLEEDLDQIDREMMRQLAIMNLKGALSSSEMEVLQVVDEKVDNLTSLVNEKCSPSLPDQDYRRCWGNNNLAQASYARLSNGSFPMAHYHGGFPLPGANHVPPMAGAPMVAMPQMGTMCVMPQMGTTCYMPPVAPVRPSADTPIAIVGEPVKEKEWSKYEDKDGTPYFHNPATGETTWSKPEGFDEQRSEREPAPPTKPKQQNNRSKYTKPSGTG